MSTKLERFLLDLKLFGEKGPVTVVAMADANGRELFHQSDIGSARRFSIKRENGTFAVFFMPDEFKLYAQDGGNNGN